MMVVRELSGDERGLGFFYLFRVFRFVRGVYRMLHTTGQAKGDDESTGVRKLSFFLYSFFFFSCINS